MHGALTAQSIQRTVFGEIDDPSPDLNVGFGPRKDILDRGGNLKLDDQNGILGMEFEANDEIVEPQ